MPGFLTALPFIIAAALALCFFWLVYSDRKQAKEKAARREARQRYVTIS
jgi:uncharacterized membrane protein YsdA (DUF1294 family)